MAFENITRGGYNIANDLYPCDINVDSKLHSTVYRNRSFIASEQEKEDAQFVAFCFNLQQKYDIGLFEEALRMIEHLSDSLEEEYGHSLSICDDARELLDRIKQNK